MSTVKDYTGRIKFKPIRNWAKQMGVLVERDDGGYSAWVDGCANIVANSVNLEELIEDVYDLAGQI